MIEIESVLHVLHVKSSKANFYQHKLTIDVNALKTATDNRSKQGVWAFYESWHLQMF